MEYEPTHVSSSKRTERTHQSPTASRRRQSIDASSARLRMCDLDPPSTSNRSTFISLVRASEAQLARWCDASARGERIEITFHERERASSDDGRENKRRIIEERTIDRCVVTHDGETSAFRAIVDDGRSVVARGDVLARESAKESAQTLGACALKFRPIRSLDDGTAARVRQRGEEELRERRERHAKVVDIGECEGEAERTPARRELERWAKIVGASVMEGQGGDIVRLRNALAALLHERPLSRNALKECVERGYALAGREEPPSQKFTRDAIKQVSAFRSPGRYELLASVRKLAADQHAMLTAIARDLKFKDVGACGGDKARRRAAATPAAETSVPTPPLQEPPRVLRGGVTVDLGGDRSPSIDLDPHAHVISRNSSFADARVVIRPRVEGDDDDAWRDFRPLPPVGVIETADEFEAVKAMYDAKYAAYLSLHVRLAANAAEYEALRKREDRRALLERFATLRRDRYAAMRVAFDALHGELSEITFACDAYAARNPA